MSSGPEKLSKNKNFNHYRDNKGNAHNNNEFLAICYSTDKNFNRSAS